MAKFPDSALMERRGITHLAAKCGELGHIWRETPNSDVGFDGEIELVTAGVATGHIIKVQVRTGPSYLRNEKPDRFDYYGDANEFEYWQESTNPVLLIIFDPRIDAAFWLDVKNYLRIHPEAVTRRPHKITFFKEERSRPLSTEGLELLFGPDYGVLSQEYLRHVIERFSKLTIYSVNSDSPLAVDLERVFITLRTTRRSISVDWASFMDHFTSTLKHGVWELSESPKTNVSVIDQPIAPIGKRITIGEALRESRNTVIIGSPGAGKTTLLKYLALTFARNRMAEQLGITESLLPLFITLRDFSRFLDNAAQRGELLDLSPQLLPDFIALHLRSVAPHLSLPVEFFMHYLESSKCVVLLDGLDEVAEPIKRMRVAEAIDSFTRQYQGNRFVVTSRPRGYEGEARQRISAQYTDWTIQDFDDADMEKFTSSWYEAVTRDRLGDSPEAIVEARGRADDLLRAIRADQRVAALAHNPLLLSVLAMVHQRGVGLPQRRAELYDECTDMLLGYWDQTKGGEAARELAQYGDLDRTEKRTLLEPIALWFHERGQKNLEADKKELRQKIADQFHASFVDQNHVAQKRAELFLRVIDERAGLLVEREVNVYSFAHLTFQEYLAARSIADSENYIEYTVQRLHDDWWREVILLEIGHLSDVRHFGRRGRKLTTELIRRIRDAGSPLESVLRRDFFFVARAMADIGPLGVDDELRQDIFRELIELWQSTPFEAQRKEAADILGYILPTSEGPRVRTAIISLLNDKDPEKIIVALKAVMQIGGSLVDEPLTSRVLALTYNSSPAVRAMAATCVEKIGGVTFADAVTTRILALSQDPEATVRLSAAGHLLSVGKAGMREEIVDNLFRLAADDDRLVREVAGSALVRISQTRSREIVERKLIELTMNPLPSVRGSGALALAQMVRFTPEEKLVRQLFALTADDDEHVRSVALDSIDEIANGPLPKIFRNRLVKLSKDDNSVTREGSLNLLKRVKTKSFHNIQALEPFADTGGTDEHYLPSVGLKAAAETEDLFLQLSANSDPGVRLRALSLLRSTSWPAGFFRTANLMYDPLLGPQRTKPQESTSPKLEKRVNARLLELLSDCDTAVRVRAAIRYRERISLPYKKVVSDILIDFWLNHVTSREEIPRSEVMSDELPWVDVPVEEQRAKVCDIGYQELKLMAKLLRSAPKIS